MTTTRAPSWSPATTPILNLRREEFRRLDRERHIYLDHAGAALAPESLMRAHLALLTSRTLGNPHSDNPAAVAATTLLERARARVLAFFGASPDEYTAIFTANATAALKLVGESYPFAPGGSLLLTADNHNSVNGLRELAHAGGATVRYVPLDPRDLRAELVPLAGALAQAPAGGHHLFAYPAQSNFSGVQHPLGWIADAHARGWDVLLDAAAFVPTNRLDLGRFHPDFVDVSFYKMFGYPTGIGCLLARKVALRKLRRPWFAGGTVTFSSVGGAGHHLADGPAAFEDGTVNFLAAPAVEAGLDFLDAVGVETIHDNVAHLAAWLIDRLLPLRHRGGEPVVQLYGPAGTVGRGGTIALNFVDPRGAPWDCRAVEALAGARRISLRAGCHCNPGARESALRLDERELRRCFEDPVPHAPDRRGVVRVSLGLSSTLDDVRQFLAFAESFADRTA